MHITEEKEMTLSDLLRYADENFTSADCTTETGSTAWPLRLLNEVIGYEQ
jgi:hypothetical protein